VFSDTAIYFLRAFMFVFIVTLALEGRRAREEGM
jgi:hypothetical protein